MDPSILCSKFDEINEKFKKIENENKLLKSEITSLKKIFNNKFNSEDVFKEKVFVSHKKHIDILSTTLYPEKNISQYKSIQISRDKLLRCIENFESGVSNILTDLPNENFPLICMEFSRNKYFYIYDNNNWAKSSDKLINEFIQSLITGPIFREFISWQNDNKDKLKSDSLSSNYHNTLQQIMKTPTNVISNCRKNFLEKVHVFN